MKKLKLFSSTLIILNVLVTPVVLAQTPPETTLTIEGQLVNATFGEPGKAGIPLMLHTYDGRQMTGMIDGETGPEGTFIFQNVELAERQLVGVLAIVGQTTYFSDVKAPSPGQATLELPVTVYDATTDASAIRIAQMHALVDFFSPTLLQITEIYIISNDGNRAVEEAVTLDGGQTASLRFTLPDSAQNLSFERGKLGERFIQTSDGFADTFGVPPGPETGQFMVSYFLPYQDGVRIDHSLSYPTDKLSVIMPRMGVSLASDDLTPAGSRQIQDNQVVDIFAVEDIQAGQSFSFELKGQPQMNVVSTTPEFSSLPATQSTSSQTPVLIGLGLVVLGLVLIGGGAWWWRRRIASPVPTIASESTETDLIWAMAELDEAYEAGIISEEDYTDQRSAMRAELKALLTHHQTDSGGITDLDKPEVEPELEMEVERP